MAASYKKRESEGWVVSVYILRRAGFCICDVPQNSYAVCMGFSVSDIEHSV